MASGDDLLHSLRKVGCTGLEKIDGDSLDWQFEKPELARFFKEFCMQINSGHLRSGKHNKTKLTSEQILTQGTGNCSDEKNKTELLESNILFKKEYSALLKMKLQHMQNLSSKTDGYHTVLESSTINNNLETFSVKQRIHPLRKELGMLLKELLISHDKLLAALSEMSCSSCKIESSSSNFSSNKVNETLESKSTQNILLETYLEKEGTFFDQIEEFSKMKETPTDQEEDHQAKVLLEEWQNEQLRLHKCFYLTVKSYNELRVITSSLHSEISFLQKMLSQKFTIQGSLNIDIQQAHERLERLESSYKDAVIQADEACEELATKALSSLLLTNFKIKLERLECQKKNQEKMLEWLREELNRLRYLQLTQKLESQRSSQMHSVCRDVRMALEKHHTVYQKWISSLTSIKESQYPPESKVVFSDDKVMNTMAEVLGSDKEELIHRFDSITEAAVSVKYKLESDTSTNERTLKSIHENLQQLEVISELLYHIQEPLKDSSVLGGNLHLAGAMVQLNTTMKSFTSSVKGFQKNFLDFRKFLQECDREVFERRQKMKLVLEKINQE